MNYSACTQTCRCMTCPAYYKPVPHNDNRCPTKCSSVYHDKELNVTRIINQELDLDHITFILDPLHSKTEIQSVTMSSDKKIIVQFSLETKDRTYTYILTEDKSIYDGTTARISEYKVEYENRPVGNIAVKIEVPAKSDINKESYTPESCAYNLMRNSGICSVLQTKTVKAKFKGTEIMLTLMKKMDGSILDLKNKKELNADTIKKIMENVHSQVLELYKKELYYMDLKLQNVLYKNGEGSIEIRLGDLGCLCIRSDDLHVETSAFESESVKAKLLGQNGNRPTHEEFGKYLSWQLGFFYVCLLVDDIGKKMCTSNMCDKYDHLAIAKEISANNGNPTMANYMNKCIKCRTGIEVNLPDFNSKTDDNTILPCQHVKYRN
jgi:hypothetical protein